LKGGLTIQELAGEEASLNSVLSEEGPEAESFFNVADPVQSSVVVEEDEEQASGSSTPEVIPAPHLVKAEIHEIKIERAPPPLPVKKSKESSESAKTNSQPSTPSNTPTTPKKEHSNSSPHKIDQTAGGEGGPSSIPIHIDRNPPTPSPTPPSQLSTPSPKSPDKIPIATPILTHSRSSNPQSSSSSPSCPRPPNTGAKTIPISRTPPSPSPVRATPTLRSRTPTPPPPTTSPPPLPPSHTSSQSSPAGSRRTESRERMTQESVISTSSKSPLIEKKTVQTVRQEECVRSEQMVIQEKVKIVDLEKKEDSTRNGPKVIRVTIEKNTSSTNEDHQECKDENVLQNSLTENDTDNEQNKDIKGGEIKIQEQVIRSVNTLTDKIGEGIDKDKKTDKISKRGVPVRIIPISLPDGRVIERKETQETSFNIEVTDYVKTSFDKKHEREESDKVEPKYGNKKGEPSDNGDEEIKTKIQGLSSSEENFKQPKASLETSLTGGSQSERKERIIPISVKESDGKSNVQEKETPKEEENMKMGDVPKSRVIPIKLPENIIVQEKDGTETSCKEESSMETVTKSVQKENVNLGVLEKPDTNDDKERTLESSKSIDYSEQRTEQTRVSFSPTPSSPIPTSPTTNSSKPPLQATRTIPILKQNQSSGASYKGAGSAHKLRSKPQTSQSSQSSQTEDHEELRRVTAELEESHRKLQKQASELAGGPRHSNLVRVETRSRSVESDQRSSSESRTNQRYRSVLRRERSLQDIDKDIETIWKELQELDTLPTDRSRHPSSPPPLSEQHLVSPPWRRSGSQPQHYSFLPRTGETRPGNITPSYVSPSPKTARSRSNVEIPSQTLRTDTSGTKPTIQPDSGSATLPNRKSTCQTTVRQSTNKPTQPANQTSQPNDTSSSNNVTVKTTTPSSYSTNSLPSRLPSSYSSTKVPIKSTEQNSTTTSIQSSSHKSVFNSGTRSYSSMSRDTESNQPPRGIAGLKSCLKSESRSSSATRSENTGIRESPGRQGVIFQSQTNTKNYQTEKRENGKVTSKTSESPPFEWVDFKSTEGGVQGSILTSNELRSDRKSPVRVTVEEKETQEEPRNIPILLTGRTGRSRSKEKTTNPFIDGNAEIDGVENKENKVTNNDTPTKEDSDQKSNNVTPTEKIALLQTSEMDNTQGSACYACDVCTQTEASNKKSCLLM